MNYVLAYKSVAHNLWVKKIPDVDTWRAAHDWATALLHHSDRVPESPIFLGAQEPDGSIKWVVGVRGVPEDLKLQMAIGGLYEATMVEKPID